MKKRRDKKKGKRIFLEERVSKKERVSPSCVDKKEMRGKKEEKDFLEERVNEREKGRRGFFGRKEASERVSASGA